MASFSSEGLSGEALSSQALSGEGLSSQESSGGTPSGSPKEFVVAGQATTGQLGAPELATTRGEALDSKPGVIGRASGHSAVAARHSRASRHGAALFVVVGVHPLQLAIPCGVVREMLQMPRVSVVPGAPPFVRGVVNLRGQVFPMIDLRLRLGLPPYGTQDGDFVKMMAQRADDHVRWLQELEACVKENRVCRINFDPLKCAFGQWYSTFQTDNTVLASLLKSFDAPHRAIHQVGSEAKQLLAAGKQGEALALVESTRHGKLAHLLGLFAKVETVLKETQREMAVVIDIPGGRRVALSVDEVRAVEAVNVTGGADAERQESESEDPLVGPAIRRENDQGLVSVLYPEHLLTCLARKENAVLEEELVPALV